MDKNETMEELQEQEVEKELPKKKKKENKYEKEIASLRQECALKEEKLLRFSAEMQNMKRRSDEERARLLKYDGEEVIIKMISILDNFEHAIKMDDNDLTDEVSKFLSGFKMIYGNMIDALKSFQVTEILCLHQEFDDMKMNAVLVDQDKNFASNTVLDVLQKGYMYKDKVIRPAMVKVNQLEE